MSHSLEPSSGRQEQPEHQVCAELGCLKVGPGPKGTLEERRSYLLRKESFTRVEKRNLLTTRAKIRINAVSGDDPMSGARASYLNSLCEQAGVPEIFNDKPS